MLIRVKLNEPVLTKVTAYTRLGQYGLFYAVADNNHHQHLQQFSYSYFYSSLGVKLKNDTGIDTLNHPLKIEGFVCALVTPHSQHVGSHYSPSKLINLVSLSSQSSHISLTHRRS